MYCSAKGGELSRSEQMLAYLSAPKDAMIAGNLESESGWKEGTASGDQAPQAAQPQRIATGQIRHAPRPPVRTTTGIPTSNITRAPGTVE